MTLCPRRVFMRPTRTQMHVMSAAHIRLISKTNFFFRYLSQRLNMKSEYPAKAFGRNLCETRENIPTIDGCLRLMGERLSEMRGGDADEYGRLISENAVAWISTNSLPESIRAQLKQQRLSVLYSEHWKTASVKFTRSYWWTSVEQRQSTRKRVRIVTSDKRLLLYICFKSLHAALRCNSCKAADDSQYKEIHTFIQQDAFNWSKIKLIMLQKMYFK